MTPTREELDRLAHRLGALTEPPSTNASLLSLTGDDCGRIQQYPLPVEGERSEVAAWLDQLGLSLGAEALARCKLAADLIRHPHGGHPAPGERADLSEICDLAAAFIAGNLAACPAERLAWVGPLRRAAFLLRRPVAGVSLEAALAIINGYDGWPTRDAAVTKLRAAICALPEAE